MKLATIRIHDNDHSSHTHAVRIEGDNAIVLDAADVGAVLASPNPPTEMESMALGDCDFAPLVVRPDKIVCVGVNYLDHIAEMGRDRPTAPTYFAKYRSALIGAHDDIVLPPPEVSTSIDWEAELAIVIGSPCRHASARQAMDAIAGFTVLNDVTARDYQRRTTQFLAGKTFEAMTPVGPILVGADEVGDASGLAIWTEVDGVRKQESNTAELCFGAVDIVQDLSRVITLEPGDIIATGTPGGVGAARTPPQWLTAGSVVHCEIEGIGATHNRCR